MLTSIIEIMGMLGRAVNDFLGKNGPQLAAAVSYYALFSLFPLALAILSGLSFILAPEAVEELALSIAEQAPVSNSTVSDILTGVILSRGIAGVTGIIGLLIAGTAVFGAIRKGINATWGITKPRPFLQERFIDISLMLIAALLILVSIFATAVLAYIIEIMQFVTRETLIDREILWDRTASTIPPILSLTVFLGLYYFLPNTKVYIQDVLPGALAATIAFEVVKNVYVLYVRDYSVYNSIYGSMGSIMALLVWVYVSAIVLLFGSLITSRYSKYRMSRQREEEYTVSVLSAGKRPVITETRIDG